MEELQKQKVLNEIQKLMFNEPLYARFLSANNFDVAKALSHFQEYLQWRKTSNIDKLLEVEINHVEKLKGYFPNGFFETDKWGRPLFILQVGSLKVKELLDAFQADVLIRYMLKELEDAWRSKFDECAQKLK